MAEGEFAGLAGKRVLVTGGSRGLGRPIVAFLAEHGAEVISVATRAGDGVDHPAVTTHGVDLTDPSAIAALAERLGDGPLDGLVGNAGLLGDIAPVTGGDPAVWERTVRVNLLANYHLLHLLGPRLTAAEAGRAVFVTSRSAYRGKPAWSAYSASKAALDALVMAFASESAETPARANLFSPGPMRTEMRAAAVPDEDPASLPDPATLAPALCRLLLPATTVTGMIYDASTGTFCQVVLPQEVG